MVQNVDFAIPDDDDDADDLHVLLHGGVGQVLLSDASDVIDKEVLLALAFCGLVLLEQGVYLFDYEDVLAAEVKALGSSEGLVW